MKRKTFLIFFSVPRLRQMIWNNARRPLCYHNEKGEAFMKKPYLPLTILCLLCTLTLAPSCAYASGDTPITDITAELEERGFPADFLAGLLDEELRELHRDTVDYVAHFADTAENGVKVSSNTPDEELDFSLAVAYLAPRETPNVIYHAVLLCRYEWLPAPDGNSFYPLSRGSDELTIHWDGSVFSPGELNGLPLFRRYETDGTGWSLTETATRPTGATADGFDFSFDLKSHLPTANRGFVSFKLYPSDGDKRCNVSDGSSLRFLDVSAEYSHTPNSLRSNFPTPVLLALGSSILLALSIPRLRKE